MSWVIKATQSGMAGRRATIGPFEDRTIAEQAMAVMATQSVGSEYDVWDEIRLIEEE